MTEAEYTYLLITPSVFFKQNLAKAVREFLDPHCKKICYISLNKTHTVARSTLKEQGVSVENVHFIDGVSTAILSPTPEQDITYLSYPLDIDELEKTIDKVIEEKGIDGIIFDSPSTLITFKDQAKVSSFFTKLIAKLTEKKIIAIFVALLEDKDKDLITRISMNVGMTKELLVDPSVETAE